MYRIQVSKSTESECRETKQFFNELNQEGGMSFNPDGSMKVILYHDKDDEPVYEHADAIAVACKAREMYDNFIFVDIFGVVIEVYEGEKKLATLDTYKRDVTIHRAP